MVLTSYHVIPEHFYSIRTETEVVWGGRGKGKKHTGPKSKNKQTEKQDLVNFSFFALCRLNCT